MQCVIQTLRKTPVKIQHGKGGIHCIFSSCIPQEWNPWPWCCQRACLVWNCDLTWPVWRWLQDVPLQKQMRRVSQLVSKSRCFIGTPDVTWLISHWLPILILPTSVVILQSCGLLVQTDTSPSSPNILLQSSHLFHSLSFSCCLLSSPLTVYLDWFFNARINAEAVIKSPDGWNGQNNDPNTDP